MLVALPTAMISSTNGDRFGVVARIPTISNTLQVVLPEESRPYWHLEEVVLV